MKNANNQLYKMKKILTSYISFKAFFSISESSFIKYVLVIMFTVSFFTCKQEVVSQKSDLEKGQKIEMVTNYGTMIFELYNETPLHRDNFINLARHGAYDSLLFHRLIHKFMIQAGDPDSRKAKPKDTLGNGDAPYVVNPEFKAELFHKKGALAAARDDNPKKASSAMQFYIVQGRVFTDSLLDRVQMRINKNKAYDYFKSNSNKMPLFDSIESALNLSDMKMYNVLMDSIYNKAIILDDFRPYAIPEKQRAIYKSVGGTPHLDQSYTVFGELLEGFEVLDEIAKVETSSLDRPINDVVIISARLLQ